LHAEYPNLHLHVVAPRTELKKGSSSIKFYSDLSAIQMRQIMLKCDLAISGGGQTLNELACCRVPVIGICFAENQRKHLSNWARTGFLQIAGDFNHPMTVAKILKALTKLDYRQRKQMLCGVGGVVDGCGAARVVDFIKERIKESNCEDRI
jgi:spore coat polysaccharide biosynthesis predicted glycosyltransferase SpsG